MSLLHKFLVLIPGIIFLIFGLGWVFAPQAIAPNFGMTVFEGLGLSSQIGDLGSYFISLSIMIIYAVKTNQPDWLYPPILMLLLTALFRTLATVIHGAPFALDMIAGEVIFSSMFFYVISQSKEAA